MLINKQLTSNGTNHSGVLFLGSGQHGGLAVRGQD